MSDRAFNSSNPSSGHDWTSSQDGASHRNDNIPYPQTAPNDSLPLEIPVTDEDRKIQRRLDRIKIRESIYLIIMILSSLTLMVSAFIVKLDKQNNTFIPILFFSILTCLLIIPPFAIASERIKKNYKHGIVEPILRQLLNYNPKASKFFQDKAPLNNFLKQINLDLFWDSMSISDCILGEIDHSPFAFVDFELTHTTGGGRNRETVVDFKGQMVYMPAAGRVPNDVINNALKADSDTLNSINSIFRLAFTKYQNQSNSFEPDSNASDFYNQYTSYSNYSKHRASENANTDDRPQESSSSTITMERARIMLSGWGTCEHYCTDRHIVFIFNNEKDPFETKASDNYKDVASVKKRILDETNWVKYIINTLKRTGLV